MNNRLTFTVSVVALCLGLIVSLGSNVQAATLNVPLEYSSIQAAINAAVDGDTVLLTDEYPPG